MKLYTHVSQLNKVGTVLEKRLKRLGIETVEDMVNYFPFRYEDYSQMNKIKDLIEGQDVTVQGKIELISTKRSPRKRKLVTEAIVTDDTGQLRIVWFGQPYISKTLKVGDMVSFSGKVKTDMFGMQMVSPSYEKVKGDGGTHTARIVPMYPLTSGITHKQMRFLMKQAMKAVDDVSDWVPDPIRDDADIMGLSEALHAIHFPESQEELLHAQRRLKFDELFLLQLRAELVRRSIRRSDAPQIPFHEKETKKFVASLSFELTKDQKVSAWKILQDMEGDSPMNRLLEGDVGSGKTVVAALALYNASLSGHQAVMMAPTEILAKQHFESLKGLLGDNVNIVLLTGSEIGNWKLEIGENTKKARREKVKDFIRSGDAQVIVGTHALLTDNVEFKNLGLVIIDEQHRFGVEQRKTIREKSGDAATMPHFLSMTATPIPRSFALALYGDLDISIIKQMPAGRKPIQTRVVEPKHRSKAYTFIHDQVTLGRQVFVICPLIEENENEKKSVMNEYEKLSKDVFPDLKIDFLHGKMKVADKDETMKKFAAGDTDILVSTSVVEVGVDIPNATVMMIEGAERFGLAQLHQFRGRVGRSDHQSYCFLFTDSDSDKAHERLGLFESTTDGFELAEHDLKLRGPGDVYGTTQSGNMHLKMANLSDHELIELVQRIARDVDFDLFPSLFEKVQAWEESIHLE